MSNPGDTPLHWAILKQNEKAVKKLLEEGADLMAENDNHQNLLRVAVDLSGYNLIEINLLIEHISEDNITEEAYLKFLNDLVDDRQNIHAQNLLKRCLTFSYINKSYPTRPSNCLWAAVRIDPFCDVVKNMLKRGVNINYSHGDDGDYRTALHIACECDNSSMGELLLKNGAAASFNDRWPFNNINLCLNLYKSAVATRHNEIIVALLDRGIDVNSRLPGSTCSLLHRAVEVNNKKIVELLISKGAYVNIEGYLGQQPISRCFKREHSSIFDIFVGNKNLSFNSETLCISTRYFPADFLERIKPLLEKVKQCGFPEKKYDLFKDFRNCYDFVKFVIENTTFRKKFGNHLGKFLSMLFKLTFGPRMVGLSSIFIFLQRVGVTPFDCLFEREFSPERVRNHWNFYEFIELISQHMFKMRLLNQFVNEKDYQKVMEVAINLYRYEEKYKKEIEKMKATNTKAVKKLLEEGADLMAENDNYQNPLRIAVNLNIIYGYNHRLVDILTEHISEDNITEETYLKFLNDLVDDRQNIHAQNFLKRCLTFSYIDISYPTRPSNCLWAAVRIDAFCDVVENMLKRGVNINYSHVDDGDYRTALHVACECDNSSMGELLLKNGAAASFNERWPFNNINLCPNLYKSAVATRHNEIIVALLDRGIDVNSRLPGSSCSLLHRAVEVNNKKMIELLISKGAYVNIEGYLGQQPISRCFKREHSSILDIFVGNKNLSFNSETLYILTRYFPADFLERIKPLLEKVKQCGFPEKKYDLFKDFRDCYDFVKFVIENTTFRKKFGNHLGKLFEYALQVNIRTKNGWSVIYIHFSSTCRYEYLSSIYGTKINIKCDKGVTHFDCLFEREFSPERVRNHWNFYEFIELISQHMFKMRLPNQFVNGKDYQKVMEMARNPYRYEEKYKKKSKR
ncbi:hypothetical protein KQX54_012774 [Cotesia glomerata]|uniref:Uncharacterized protein n=1 Tax=Cotesia glomerata TaxID=32391 RepID=A0AAV7IDC4_COTGL|nr:hypothetical protein KQX54_012774 [Cotesia glomerata]